MRLTKGFTLIEMVIVILLIGIMSGIAIPRFEKRIELEELKSEKEFTYTIWKLLPLQLYKIAWSTIGWMQHLNGILL